MASRGPISRCLVVDADIARAAGTTEHLVSSACRKVLETILRVCHRVVFSPSQHEEWRKHQSSYSRKWLTQMVSRKKIELLNDEPDSGIHAVVDSLDVAHKKREAMWKDAHLIELAIATDKRVLSMDEIAYRHFHDEKDHLKGCTGIQWSNPLRQGDDVINWLVAGAPDEAKRCIGTRVPKN